MKLGVTKETEIDVTYAIMKSLKQFAETDRHDKSVQDLVMMLFENSFLISGFDLEDSFSSLSSRADSVGSY